MLMGQLFSMITQHLNQMEELYLQLLLDKFCYTEDLTSISLGTGESNSKHLCTILCNCYNVYSYGASIVAETQRIPDIFQRLLNNPLCFLLYEDKGVVPNEWNEVSATMVNLMLGDQNNEIHKTTHQFKELCM